MCTIHIHTYIQIPTCMHTCMSCMYRAYTTYVHTYMHIYIYVYTLQQKLQANTSCHRLHTLNPRTGNLQQQVKPQTLKPSSHKPEALHPKPQASSLLSRREKTASRAICWASVWYHAVSPFTQESVALKLLRMNTPAPGPQPSHFKPPSVDLASRFRLGL